MFAASPHLLLCAAAALLAGTTLAQVIEGQVVGVHDGDSITVLDGENVQHKVRLLGIDAPEKKQAFGERAKQALSRLVFNGWVRVAVQGKDRYGRTLGNVYVAEKWVNLAMIQEGMAWVYKNTKDKALLAAQESARLGKRGLWRDQSALPPWVFRKEEKAK